MTSSQISWASQHFDWFDYPYSNFLPQYKADTKAPILWYDDYYCIYVGKAKYNAMVSYVNAHNLNLEDMFLHFSTATTITFANETYTLPAGSRVPTYSWYGTGGDLTKSGALVIMYPGNPNFRAFNAAYEQSQLATSYGGATYDGIFVDNSVIHVLLNNNGTIVSGGAYAEYPGTSSVAAAAYDSDMALVFASVRSILGAKGVAGSKLQVANGAISNVQSSANWTALFPYIDESYMEFALVPQLNSDNFIGTIGAIATANAAKVPAITSAHVAGSAWTAIASSDLMDVLAEYYLAATPSSYFVLQDLNSGDPETYGWFPAIEYNVGSPSVGAPNTVTPAGSQANGYYVLAIGKDPSDSLATYKVLARLYDNALVLYKGQSSWNTTTGSVTNTIHNLPVTSDNPTGIYYQLNADGTVGSTAMTTITLGNAEGAVLVKASALNLASPPTALKASVAVK